MRNLVAFPVLGLVLILQTSIFSQVQLLSGAADLVLLVIAAWALQPQVDSAWHWALLAGMLTAFISAMPFVVPLASLAITVVLARAIQRRILNSEWVSVLSVTILGTLASHLLSFIGLVSIGVAIDLQDVVAFITLPSLFANLLLCLPVHSLIRDLALWVYPPEEIV